MTFTLFSGRGFSLGLVWVSVVFGCEFVAAQYNPRAR
jgi:hypothetical protein